LSMARPLLIRHREVALQDSSDETRRSETLTSSCILALEKMRGSPRGHLFTPPPPPKDKLFKFSKPIISPFGIIQPIRRIRRQYSPRQAARSVDLTNEIGQDKLFREHHVAQLACLRLALGRA
jgi:hypothetical protein